MADNIILGTRTTVVSDGRHNAFPGAVLLGGDVLAAYRAGPDHLGGPGTSRGTIYTTRYDGTWSAPVQIVDADPADARDPMLSQLSNGDVALTYFTADSGLWRAWLVLGDGTTWSTPMEIETGYDDTIVSCPVRHAGVTLYVRNGVNAWSALWWPVAGEPVLIANGPADGRNYVEPYVVQLADGSLLCLIRETTTAAIWSSTSADGGASWTLPAPVFDGIGRPAFLQLPDGRLLSVVRRRTPLGVDQEHLVRLSDDGVTWTAGQSLDLDPGRSVYAEPVLLGPTTVGFAYALEDSTTAADVYWRTGEVTT